MTDRHFTGIVDSDVHGVTLQKLSAATGNLGVEPIYPATHEWIFKIPGGDRYVETIWNTQTTAAADSTGGGAISRILIRHFRRLALRTNRDCGGSLDAGAFCIRAPFVPLGQNQRAGLWCRGLARYCRCELLAAYKNSPEAMRRTGMGVPGQRRGYCGDFPYDVVARRYLGPRLSLLLPGSALLRARLPVRYHDVFHGHSRGSLRRAGRDEQSSDASGRRPGADGTPARHRWSCVRCRPIPAGRRRPGGRASKTRSMPYTRRSKREKR